MKKSTTYHKSADIECQVIDTFQFLQCVKEDFLNTYAAMLLCKNKNPQTPRR